MGMIESSLVDELQAKISHLKEEGIMNTVTHLKR